MTTARSRAPDITVWAVPGREHAWDVWVGQHRAGRYDEILVGYAPDEAWALTVIRLFRAEIFGLLAGAGPERQDDRP